MSDTTDTIVSACFNYCCILCGIFMLITFLDLIGMYNLAADDPQMVLGYISIIHLIALPLYYFRFLGKGQGIFLLLNLLWIMMMVTATMVFALSNPATGTAVANWKENPLSHVLLTVYITCGLLLEIFIFIARRKKVTSHVQSVTTSVHATSPQSQVMVPVQQQEYVTTTTTGVADPNRRSRVYVNSPTRSVSRSPPPPRPPPPAALVTYQQQVQPQQQQVVYATSPTRPPRTRRTEAAIISPTVLSTTSGNAYVTSQPAVQYVTTSREAIP